MKTQEQMDQEAAADLAREYADHSPGLFWSWGGVINLGLKCIAYGRANPVVSGLPKYDYDDKILNDWSKNKRDSYPKPMHYGDLLTIIGGIARRAFERGQKSGVSHERAKLQKVREALEKAEKRFSHIENWHRDYVTPDFKDCQEVGMTPEEYLRAGKIEIREALVLLDGKGE